jgi:antitoxin component HigA of HigAB toxin-antitoxin module
MNTILEVMMRSKKVDMDFLGVLSSCLEQYIKGKIKPIEVLKLVEHSLPEEDKANWDPKSEFKGYELIETFLEVKGMTQAELSQQMNLTPAKINDIIKGRRKITPKTAKSLAKVFSVEHTVFL